MDSKGNEASANPESATAGVVDDDELDALLNGKFNIS
jgi:hypothetical protein